MSKKIRWITETAVMLALLVCLQALTKPMGQLVTGSCVNAVLAVSALVGGLSCGLVVALCSPVLAFLLGIAPPDSDCSRHYGRQQCFRDFAGAAG